MILKWDFDFEENRTYILEIDGVADFAGNVISKTDFAFTFTGSPVNGLRAVRAFL